MKAAPEYILDGEEIFIKYNNIRTKSDIKRPKDDCKAEALVRRLNKEKKKVKINYIGASKRELRLQKLRDKRRSGIMKIEISGIEIPQNDRTKIIGELKKDNYWKSVKIKEVSKEKFSIELSKKKLGSDEEEISNEIEKFLNACDMISITDDFKLTFS